MRKQITAEVLQMMLRYLNNEQLNLLRTVLDYVLSKYESEEDSGGGSSEDLINLSIEAKRIEGYSEKTLNYC